jgi:large subunit ribosomal protein L23
MAIFGKKDKETKIKEDKKEVAPKAEAKKATKKAEKPETSAPVTKATEKNLSNIILKPRITEKAAIKADEANAYTFEVHKSATKTDVAEAIEKIYKVVPKKVNIVINPRKIVRNRKGSGFKGGVKKAIVFLKKGDKIDFV